MPPLQQQLRVTGVFNQNSVAGMEQDGIFLPSLRRLKAIVAAQFSSVTRLGASDCRKDKIILTQEKERSMALSVCSPARPGSGQARRHEWLHAKGKQPSDEGGWEKRKRMTACFPWCKDSQSLFAIEVCADKVPPAFRLRRGRMRQPFEPPTRTTLYSERARKNYSR